MGRAHDHRSPEAGSRSPQSTLRRSRHGLQNCICRQFAAQIQLVADPGGLVRCCRVVRLATRFHHQQTAAADLLRDNLQAARGMSVRGTSTCWSADRQTRFDQPASYRGSTSRQSATDPICSTDHLPVEQHLGGVGVAGRAESSSSSEPRRPRVRPARAPCTSAFVRHSSSKVRALASSASRGCDQLGRLGRLLGRLSAWAADVRSPLTRSASRATQRAPEIPSLESCPVNPLA